MLGAQQHVYLYILRLVVRCGVGNRTVVVSDAVSDALDVSPHPHPTTTLASGAALASGELRSLALGAGGKETQGVPRELLAERVGGERGAGAAPARRWRPGGAVY